jgi:hypothetical protein
MPEAGIDPPGAVRALADDFRFLQRHLSQGGVLRRLDHVLVVYRHHPLQLSHSTHSSLLRTVRARAFEQRVLNKWTRFSVWGSGRDAKAFLSCLSEQSRRKVVGIAEVDMRKVGTIFESRALGMRVPIVHFSTIQPPAVICVAKGRTHGELEDNVASAGLTEGETCWFVV